ncbi:MAG: glycoside hydrolase family 2 TIM barrel-domain containing protein [Akkermansia sp.]
MSWCSRWDWRTVSVNPKEGFVLNGKTMQIKGVSRHQDMKGKGWALSPEDEARDIRLIADMGADGVRTGHYPASTNIYDLCDKAGLIVWSEVPNVNLVWDTPEFRENNRLQAREMIFQHWNHPSICMWEFSMKSDTSPRLPREEWTWRLN